MHQTDATSCNTAPWAEHLGPKGLSKWFDPLSLKPVASNFLFGSGKCQLLINLIMLNLVSFHIPYLLFLHFISQHDFWTSQAALGKWICCGSNQFILYKAISSCGKSSQWQLASFLAVWQPDLVGINAACHDRKNVLTTENWNKLNMLDHPQHFWMIVFHTFSYPTIRSSEIFEEYKQRFDGM